MSQDTKLDQVEYQEVRGDEIALDVHELVIESTAEQLDEEEQQNIKSSRFTREDKSNMIKLSIMIAMVVVFFVAELVVGYVGKSLAMVSDAFHMLSDGISLIIGLVAIIIAKKKSSSTLSYGWGRAELLGGLINGVFLISVVLFIYLEAFQRFFEPTKIENPLLVLIVGVLGMAVNIVGMIMFCGHAHHGHSHDHGHSHGSHTEHKHNHSHPSDHEHNNDHEDHEHSNHQEQLQDNQSQSGHSHGHVNFNMLGVFLHVFGDFLGSIGVVVTAGLLMIFDVNKHRWLIYVDPAISSILATIILFSSLPLVINCAKILLQRVPNNIEMKNLKREILTISGVQDVHELHIWQFVNSKIICSVHVKVDPSVDFYGVASAIQAIMHRNGIHSTTIQPEPVSSCHKSAALKGQSCEMTCAKDCSDDWCCPPATVDVATCPSNNTNTLHHQESLRLTDHHDHHHAPK